MITTYQDFIENYLVFDGQLANAENVNKAPDQLKKEVMEVISNLGSLASSKQVLDINDAISVNGKVVTIKKGDGSTESISLDLFDTVVPRITSVDNRVPKFNGTNGSLSLTAVNIDDTDNLVVPGSITSNTGVLNGNSTTATKLQTARTISLTGGLTATASFDGSANIALNATITNNSHTHTSANITDATNTNVANTIVKRDSNGNFSAGIMTGSLSGNATTATTAQTTTGNAGSATKLQTARTISLAGVVSGSATFDGSANVTLNTTHNSDPTISLTGAVTGSAIMYDLGNVSINTTITNDSHTHDERYYTENESDNRFLKLTGGTLSGGLVVNGGLSANAGLSQDRFTILNGSDTWLRTQGDTGWYNATYQGGMHMIDSTWVRTYGGKSLHTDGNLSVNGSASIGAHLTVASNQAGSYIYMTDNDEGTRHIHCNSNRIGFLDQSGNWGSYCDDTGAFWSTQSFTAPNFYGKLTGTGTGNDYNSGGVMLNGNGTANTIFPTLGFHQPGLYASTIQLRAAGEFYFYQQGAGAYANVTAGYFRGTSTSALYADLAEKYLTDKEYEIGTVLEFGGEKELTIYNGGTLAGVISENPGFILNENSVGQPVALKGKTPVKCLTEIKRGQYCIADKNGFVKGYDKKDLTFELSLDVVGIALEDSQDNLVMVKI